MRFISLGSGSEGNALVVECGNGPGTVRLLIDSGFALRECVRRLARIGLEPAMLDAVLVTHEHGDHIGSAFAVAERAGVPVYLTHGTLAAMPRPLVDRSRARVIAAQESFEVGGVDILPLTVPHDAREPVQFLVDDGRHRLGILTDLGHATPALVAALHGLSGLVLECNHDEQMLESGRYPASLKRRVGGDWGHLSNRAAAALLGQLPQQRLQRVLAAHLSQQNNRPELACAAIEPMLARPAEQLCVADQDGTSGWQVLEAAG